MTRVSLREAYDNKDVIQLIFANKDAITELQEQTVGYDTQIAEMNTKINTNANDIITINATIAGMNGTIALKANQNDLIALQTIVNGSIKNITFEPNESTVNFSLLKQDGSIALVAFPIASETQAGGMNSAMYTAFVGYNTRISALENQQLLYPVSLPSNTPTQAEILSAYLTKYPLAPNPPVIGTVVVDYTRAIQFTYDGETFLNTTPSIIGIATDSMTGVVMGSNVPGQNHVETNGTLSVNGWDEAQTAIANNTANILANATAIADTNTRIDNLIVSASNISISTWVANTDNTTAYDKGFIYMADVAVTGMLETMYPKVEVDDATYITGNVWNRYNSLAGVIRIYSKTNTTITVLTAIGMVIA